MFQLNYCEDNMNLRIKGKKALVTASGRGIGRSIAKALAEEGVILTVIARTESDVKSLIKEIGGKTKGHKYIIMDLMRSGSVNKVVDYMHNVNFCPDIIVHNLGGTLDINDPFCAITEWKKIFKFNLEIAVELNLALIPKMREKKWGRIVHISSISGSENHGPIPYCSAKAALNAYVRSLGRVLAPDGISVSAVLPGAIFTEGGYWDKAVKERPQHVDKYLKERMAIRRFGKLEEISKLVAFMCSEYAAFCVGSLIPVDGGQGRTFNF